MGFLVVEDQVITKRRSKFPLILGSNSLRALFKNDKVHYDSWDVVDSAFQTEVTQPIEGLTLKTRSKREVLPPLAVRRMECVIANSNKEMDILVASRAEGPVKSYEGFPQRDGMVYQLTVANKSEREVVITPGTVLASAVAVDMKEKVVAEPRNGFIGVTIAELWKKGCLWMGQSLDCK
ncbi:uncharacterized protein LOC117110688 [Anneissia japonica]|uniref:uncharacterized protein LOC117110688 n=1 Tax=Anneissia japonica TaxID=1529436 RepID=UPI001425945B|nr:uncharacterized protein LOC117110688 [Anneissia japonica]